MSDSTDPQFVHGCRFCGAPYGCLCHLMSLRNREQQARFEEAHRFFKANKTLAEQDVVSFIAKAIEHGRELERKSRETPAPAEFETDEQSRLRRFEAMELGELEEATC